METQFQPPKAQQADHHRQQARQFKGQIPPYFPETFKDFFSILTEDEDHVELISNILEDKVIPRSPQYLERKQCEKPFCCHNNGNNNSCQRDLDSQSIKESTSSITRTYSTKYYRNRGQFRLGSSGLKDPSGSADLAHFGRSSSFRLSRPTYSNYSSLVLAERSNLPGCKHVKYCCLHQANNYDSPSPLQIPSHSDTFLFREGHHLRRELTGVEDGTDIIEGNNSFIYPPLYPTEDERENDLAKDDPEPRLNQRHPALEYLSNDSYDSISRSSNFYDNRTEDCGSVAGSSNLEKNPSRNWNESPVINAVGSVAKSTPNPMIQTGGGYQPATRTGQHPINIIANPFLRQYHYPEQSNSNTGQKGVKMYSGTDGGVSSAIVSHQVAPGNLKTLSYGPKDLKKSPVVNRRRSCSVTLPQPDLQRFLTKPEPDYPNSSSSSGFESRLSRDRYSQCKSPVNNPPVNKENVIGIANQQHKQQKSGSHQQQQQQQQSGRPTKQKQRMRTASMPAENRKPRLSEMRRSAIHCAADVDIEYYRLRSFSITSHGGICNLGDSMRSRRSRSINSVTSTGTSNSGRGDRNNSNASAHDLNVEADQQQLEVGGGGGSSKGNNGGIPAYKVAMLGATGVGKTALTYQFTTSEYICAYDLSLDDDYGQKTVSVLLNGEETDLEIVDHPACEMSTEAFCSTYSIDLFVVVYSVVDRNTFESAEKVLHYLRENEMLLTRGAILVGNKTDLERHRKVPIHLGKKLAKEINCKFIETSSGLDHNVDELLVGIVAQVKLNPQRICNLSEKQRLILCHQNNTKSSGVQPKNGRVVRKRQGAHASGPLDTMELFSLKNSIKSKQQKKRTPKNQVKGGMQGNEGGLNEEDEDNKSTSSSSSSLLCYSDDNSVKSSQSSISNRNRGDSNQSNSAGCSTNSTPIKKGDPHHRHGSLDRAKNKHKSNQNRSSSADDKAAIKFTNRTKLFLTSFLKFKKSLSRVKRRRSSSSCSDLFAI